MDDVPPDRGRTGEIRRLTEEMDRSAVLAEGHFNALGMLVTDASLAADGSALEAAQDGLQWLFRRYAGLESPRSDEVEHRGRLLGLIDTTHWALRRLPSALQLSLDPHGHAARFLVAVARQPGLSNQDVAARLGADETETSRVGRRLLAAGLVWRRKHWRRNVWDLTPRGRQYLATSGLLPAEAAAAGHPAIGAQAPAVAALTHAVGVKVLPGLLVGVVTDHDAEVLGEQRRPLPGPLVSEEAVAELAAFVRDLLDALPEAAADPARVGLGVEIGGHVLARTGEVVYAPNYAPHGDWAGFPLADRLAGELGLPTVVDNDANALAEFERAFGADAGVATSATVLLDEGVGCGLVIDGRVVSGAGGSAGEIGHLVVEPDGARCRCGNRGCLETVAGVVAILDALSDPTDRKVTDLATAARLAARGDRRVTEVIGRAGGALGTAMSAVLNLVNPEQVVLYGPAELVDEATHPTARRFMTALRRASAQHTFSDAGRGCRVVARTYTYRVGAQAAAAVALLRATAPGGSAGSGAGTAAAAAGTGSPREPR